MPNALFTDFYELTMMAGYHATGRAEEPASFDLFFRHNPQGVDFVVCAGLDPVLDYLERLSFDEDDLAYLASLDRFAPEFLDWLGGLQFTGDVWAIPEGTVVFGGEPLLRVDAPLGQGQLVETALINRIAYSSLIASNAYQVIKAARGKPVLEFGARRAHGPDGAVTATRAAMIGGCTSTSNVEAARRFGLAVSGTQAHSWIMAWNSELEAFRAYAETFPEDTILLIDTYDTLEVGLPHAIQVASELAERGHRLGGVRLDSGDLAALAKEARARLDAAGFAEVKVLASGDLDSPSIAELEAQGAPIDGYGVGTALVTAKQDPAFSGVYKLSEVGGNPVMKLSSTPAKATDPGRKQVWRTAQGDVIGLVDDEVAGRPLLGRVMRHGRRARPPEPITDLARRSHASAAEVGGSAGWPISRTPRLTDLRGRLTAERSPSA